MLPRHRKIGSNQNELKTLYVSHEWRNHRLKRILQAETKDLEVTLDTARQDYKESRESIDSWFEHSEFNKPVEEVDGHKQLGHKIRDNERAVFIFRWLFVRTTLDCWVVKISDHKGCFLNRWVTRGDKRRVTVRWVIIVVIRVRVVLEQRQGWWVKEYKWMNLSPPYIFIYLLYRALVWCYKRITTIECWLINYNDK